MITSRHPFSLAASNNVVFSVYVVFPAEIRLSLPPELSFGCGFTSGDIRHTPPIFSLLTVSVAFRRPLSGGWPWSLASCPLSWSCSPVRLISVQKGSGHFGSGAFVSYGDSTFWPFLCLSAYGLSRPSGLWLLLLFSACDLAGLCLCWPLSVLGL